MAEKKKSGLGRGLNSIFGSDVEQFLEDIQNNGGDAPGRKEVEIPISEIRPNPYQPRKEFEEKSLNELADSIRLHGIFTPLLVRPSVQGYELIAGERRLRAAKIAGLTTVPAISVDFTERVGKSREYCANMLRLLKLPYPVQEMVTEKQLTMGHVRPLLALSDEEDMLEAAQKIRKERMSVREVERYVKELAGGNRPEKKQRREPEKDPLIRDLENRMTSKLGTKVVISGKNLTIRFTDTADLNRILDLLGMIEE